MIDDELDYLTEVNDSDDETAEICIIDDEDDELMNLF